MRQDDRHVGKIDRHVLKIKSVASPGDIAAVAEQLRDRRVAGKAVLLVDAG
jgi:hypothetical protein